jgi:PKD repeat protein
MRIKLDFNLRPVARIAADRTRICLGQTIYFDGSQSYDQDSGRLSYKWDFGDGDFGRGPKVEHTYEEGGLFKVMLVVNDNSRKYNSSDSATMEIEVNSPPTARVDILEHSLGDLRVVFDGSGSSDPQGQRLRYNWNFGDGSTGSGERPEHIYRRGGTYRVTLTVDDGSGSDCSSDSASIEVGVNSQPKADMEITGSLCAQDEFLFDASGSSDADADILEYFWDFGDGYTASGEEVTHAYQSPGMYRVRLVVRDSTNFSNNASTSLAHLKVNTPPVADAGMNLVCCVGQEALFDATSSYDHDGDDLVYYWRFGDGESATGPVVRHTYTEPGSYKVSLWVEDDSESACSIDEDFFIAEVKEEPVAIIKINQD